MIPDRFAPAAYALFRVVFGYIFFCFGAQKMFGWFGGQVAPLMSMQGAAGVIETVAGLLIAIGLFTRLAAFIASGEMAVAYFYIHVSVVAMGEGGAGLPLGLLVPQLNNGVNAALFSVAFLYMASRGSGICSVDGVIGGKGASRPR